MITNTLWPKLYNIVCFSLTVHLLHNCLEQNFWNCSLKAVKHWFANNQLFILLHTIVTATASISERGFLQNLQKI